MDSRPHNDYIKVHIAILPLSSWAVKHNYDWVVHSAYSLGGLGNALPFNGIGRG